MPQIKVLAELGQDNDLRLFAVREAEALSGARRISSSSCNL